MAEYLTPREAARPPEAMPPLPRGAPACGDACHRRPRGCGHPACERGEHARVALLLRRVNRALTAITACNQAIVRATGELDLLAQVCQAIADTGGYCLAWVGYAQHDAARTVRPMARAGRAGAYLDAVSISWADTPEGRGPAGRTIREGVPHTARNVLLDADFAPWRASALAYGFASSISLPLRVAGEVIGILAIHAVEPDAFDGEEEQLLARLADDLAYGIGARRTAAERARAETALRESEARFRAIFEQAAVGMAQVAPDGRWLMVNDRLCEILGYAREELLRLRLYDITHPEDLPKDEVRMREAGSPDFTSITFEKRFLRKDRSVVWAAVTVAVVRGERGERLYHVSVFEDITARKQAEEALQRLALHDPLTGLPNRTLLLDRAAQALLDAARRGTHAALLLLDLDHFKEINDTFGHATGDALLIGVAERLRESLRATDTVGRLGGDEFAVVLREADRAGAETVAATLHAALDRAFTVNGATLRAEASIGIAIFPEHGPDAQALLQHADVAMYQAKRGARAFSVYLPETDVHSPEKLAFVEELRAAVLQGQLALHYQPIVEAATQRVHAVEALVRWPHATRGQMPPDAFLPVVARLGLHGGLTSWVVREALRQQRAWRDAGLPLAMNINFSATDLHDAALIDDVAALLAERGGVGDGICIEVTEHALIADLEQTRAALCRLSMLGARIAIDDFGTGYSSLSRLARLPVDELKIDRSFVQGLAEDRVEATIVASTIGLGQSLGLRLVAEGVEDRETAGQLTSMGCDALQGYYFARPLPPAELERMLRAGEWGAGAPDAST